MGTYVSVDVTLMLLKEHDQSGSAKVTYTTQSQNSSKVVCPTLKITVLWPRDTGFLEKAKPMLENVDPPNTFC